MAHFLHFCKIREASAAQAAEAVLTEISDWGTDDNWRVVGGVCSEDNLDNIENLGGGRWSLDSIEETINPKKGEVTIDGSTGVIENLPGTALVVTTPFHYYNSAFTVIRNLTKEIQFPWSQEVFHSLQEAKEYLIQKLIAHDFESTCYSDNCFPLLQVANQLEYLVELQSLKYSLENHPESTPEFYSRKYDNFGMTDFEDVYNGAETNDEGERLQWYIVLLDTHG
jgi:hypothetical protein